MSEEDLGYGDANAAPARPPPGGRRRERKGSLAFIQDHLPTLPNLPQIPAMLMPTMPAMPNMPGMPHMPNINPFAQRQTHDDSSSSDDVSASGKSSSSESEPSSSKVSKSDASDNESKSESESESDSDSDTGSHDNRNLATPVQESLENRSVQEDPDETTSSSSDEADELENGKPSVAAAQTRYVRRLRRIFILTLIAVAAVVATYANKLAKSDTSSATKPSIITTVVAVMFFIVLFLFCTFNFAVEKRHRILKKAAKQVSTPTTILASISPDKNKDMETEDVEKAPNRPVHGSEKEFTQNDDHTGSDQTNEDPTNNEDEHNDETDKDPTEATRDPPSRSHHDQDDSSTESSSDDDERRSGSLSRNPMIKEPSKTQLKTILQDEKQDDQKNKSIGLEGLTISDKSPVADFFPHCTVLFADIVNFNAWSSSREPEKVFTLLEAVYNEFDLAAKRKGVFKVETIGDSYVAVTGLPEAQPNHAVIMASFALECRRLMREVTIKLERELGPETVDDLCLRIGMHSGPVTAGLLRGEKSRFQLFGDTVNIASRMESTAEENLIQVSSATAKLLEEGGKGDWLLKREGVLVTQSIPTFESYWLEKRDAKSGRRFSVAASCLAFDGKGAASSTKNDPMIWASESIGSLDSTTPSNGNIHESDSTARIVEWNVDALLKLLRQVVAYRKSVKKIAHRRASIERSVDKAAENEYLSANAAKGISVLDVITDVVRLPAFDPEIVIEAVDPNTVTIDAKVKKQLRQFVQVMAGTYLPNPFHNYEHAIHVQMSMIKLLSRVTSPEHIDFNGDSTTVASDAHDFTFGITSDPLTQFSVVFAGLCHDCAHTGVPNSQLVKEKANVANIYRNKCVAEQNSVDLAWSLLMHSDYEALRGCIYSNESEFKRFRQLMVNLIIATDIFDRQLNEQRAKRWKRAFNEANDFSDAVEEINRKATIVVEYLIQASDIAHTMQHWSIYKKWNERLFKEMWVAFESGRTDTNPSYGWYKGELWFFDNYVLPLAKKLKECRVFGVSSDECLNYATENRAAWATEGERIVARWVNYKTTTCGCVRIDLLLKTQKLVYGETKDFGLKRELLPVFWSVVENITSRIFLERLPGV